MTRRRLAPLAILGLVLLAGCDQVKSFVELFQPDKELAEEEVTWSQGALPLERSLALVLDNSGSMKRNDRDGMMLFSALVFLDMLDDEDSVYITSFPGKDHVQSDRLPTAQVNAACQVWMGSRDDAIGPLSNSPEGNAELKDWVRDLEYSSQITVFQEPVQRAVEALAADGGSGKRRYIVLFTDGNTDRGGDRSPTAMAAIHDLEREALTRYRKELLRHNIVFYAVVLGSATRDDHLKPLADATGGAVLRANTPNDLVDRFAEVFGRILETKVEPVTLGASTREQINRYVKEFILFMPSGGNGAGMGFREPDGRSLDGGMLPDDGYVRRDGVRELEPYQIIHVNDPRPGNWEFNLSGADEAPALLIQNYDVYLQINGSYPRRSLMNVPSQILGRLVDSRGQPIADTEFYAEGDFRYAVEYVGDLQETPPGDDLGFELEVTPRDTLFHDLVCTATNGTWLTRSLKVSLAGKDGVLLQVNNPADFGSPVPYADGLYFWWCRWLTKLMGLPAAEDWRHNKARVTFKGTDEALKGVVFQLDETALYEEYGLKLVDHRHRPRFVIGEDYSASFRLDLDRDARRPDGVVQVPIIYPSSAGKIRGDRSIGVKADVQELNWLWKTSHLWLQWLIYLWLFLFFIYRPLHYVSEYSTRSIHYRPRRNARRFSRPHPNENGLLAYFKALILLYPWQLVSGLKRAARGGGTPTYYIDGGFMPGLRRLLLTLLGIPVGPYARPFTAMVGNKRTTFYRSGRDITINASHLAALTKHDPPRDRRILIKAPGRIAYPVVNSEEDGLFVILNK